MPLDMVGLCVLLDADEQIFESLASIFERKKLKDKRANVKDNLMENLLGYKLKNRDINTSHIINNGLPGLRQAIALKDTDKLQAEKVMKEYFDKISIMTLYGDMNDPMPHTYEKHYRGYWDFKGAAVSKLCGLDDSSYRDSIHYPVDLVEYHRQS